MSRVIEVRRHSYTKKGDERGLGSHVSAEGVRFARRVGESTGPFARVVCSDIPRTLETAIAMGFAVDGILEFPGALDWDAVIGEMGWHALWEIEHPFAHIAGVLPSKPHTEALGRHYAAEWLRIAGALGDDETALVVTHGTIIEVALVVTVPDADHAAWGKPFSHCEGFRLAVDGSAITAVELLRL